MDNKEINTDEIVQNKNRKNRYIKLKNELVSICEELRSGKMYVDEANNQLSKNYLIDNESADQGKLSKLSNEIDETINYIQTKLIPNINYEINEINNNITDLTKLLDSEEEK